MKKARRRGSAERSAPPSDPKAEPVPERHASGNDAVRGETNADHGDREDLVQRRARAMGRRQDPHPHAHPALRHRRVRGHPRVRDRARSGSVPLDRAHRTLVQLGQDHVDGDPLHGRRDRAGDQGHRARNGLAVVLHPADRVLRLRRDGPQHVAVRGRRRDRVLAMGRVSRRRGSHQGRAHEDLDRGRATTTTRCRRCRRRPATTSTRHWRRSRP